MRAFWWKEIERGNGNIEEEEDDDDDDVIWPHVLFCVYVFACFDHLGLGGRWQRFLPLILKDACVCSAWFGFALRNLRGWWV